MSSPRVRRIRERAKLRPARALVSVLLGTVLLSGTPAAQQAFPWATFLQLVERKGDDLAQEGPCLHLGLNRNCRVYQAARQEDEWFHAFNVVRVGDRRSGHVILYKRSDAGHGSFYLTDRKGTFLRAVSRSEGTSDQASWSKLSTTSREVQRGFAEELAYWRGQQVSLESEPDRKD